MQQQQQNHTHIYITKSKKDVTIFLLKTYNLPIVNMINPFEVINGLLHGIDQPKLTGGLKWYQSMVLPLICHRRQ
jgi:hypothetical protein